MSLLTKTHSVKTGTMCRSTYNTCFSVHFQRIAFSVDHYKFSCSWNHVVMVHACRQRRVGGRHLDTKPSNTHTWLCWLFSHTHTYLQMVPWKHFAEGSKDYPSRFQRWEWLFFGAEQWKLCRKICNLFCVSILSKVYLLVYVWCVCVDLVVLVANIPCTDTSAQLSIWQPFLEADWMYFGIIHSHHVFNLVILGIQWKYTYTTPSGWTYLHHLLVLTATCLHYSSIYLVYILTLSKKTGSRPFFNHFTISVKNLISPSTLGIYSLPPTTLSL